MIYRFIRKFINPFLLPLAILALIWQSIEVNDVVKNAFYVEPEGEVSKIAPKKGDIYTASWNGYEGIIYILANKYVRTIDVVNNIKAKDVKLSFIAKSGYPIYTVTGQVIYNTTGSGWHFVDKNQSNIKFDCTTYVGNIGYAQDLNVYLTRALTETK